MRGSIDYAGTGDGHRDVADQRRADVYSSVRIGAAAALTLVLVVLLVLDVAVPDYDTSTGILLPLLGAILALLGLQASAPLAGREMKVVTALLTWLRRPQASTDPRAARRWTDRLRSP